MFFQRSSATGYVRMFVRREMETGRETELYRERVQGLAFLALSPDGRQVALTCGAILRVMPAVGGKSRVLWETDSSTETPSSSGMAWTPDGRHLLLGKDTSESSKTVQLWQVPLDGSKPQKAGLEMSALRHLQISPDGRQITFTGQTSDRHNALWVLENPPLP